MSKYSKKYYKKNRKKILQKLKMQRSKSKKEFNKKAREYYQKNIVKLRKQIAERQRRYNAAKPRILSDNPVAIYNRESRKKFKKKYGISSNQIYRYGENALNAVKKANGRCEKCGSKKNLVIHHKDNKGRNYVEKRLKLNNNLNNLIVLCVSCHSTLHGKLRRK